MLDLIRLRHVLLVAREGSFARAAHAANLSQPALSRSIQSIERQFGIKLFDRSRAGVVLTEAGHSFLALTEPFVRRAESLEGELRVISSGIAGTVAFGIGPLAATLLLDQLSDLLFARDIRTSVRIEGDPSLRRALIDGEIEFYIGGAWGGTRDFVVSSRLRKDLIGDSHFALAVRRDHPLAGRGQVAREELERFPLIGGTVMRAILDEAVLAEVGLRHPSLELDNYDVLVDIAARTDAILLTSPYLLSTPRGRRVIQLAVALPPERANIPAVLVTLADRTLSPAAAQLAHRLTALLSGLIADYEIKTHRPA